MLGGASPVFPQVSVNVSTLDPVYRDIDKLVGHGLVSKIIMGQRPFSRREIARIAGEALRNYAKLQEKLNEPSLSGEDKEKIQKKIAYLKPIFERFKRDYEEELVQVGALSGQRYVSSAHPIEKIDVAMNVNNSLPRLLNNDTGVGGIDAVINPMLQYQQGRHLVDGTNLSLETHTWFRASDYFAFYVQPRFQLGIGRDSQPNDIDAYLMNLYGKLYLKNIELEVGRDNLVWGQGQDSGLLLSNNPRGLDMFKLSNDEPFFFPWVFKYLGANKISFFWANLGPEQNFPYAYLLGYKWSLQPLSFLEIGASIATQSGGQGSPYASFGDRVKDAFPVTQIFSGSQAQVGNKIGGLDMRLRVPPLRDLELYGETVWDDTQSPFHNPHAFFVWEAGYVAGFYLPRIDVAGKTDLRFEFHQTGTRMYRHGQFNSGWTENQFILGDNLGPDSKGFYLTSNWDISPQDLLTFKGAYEYRRNDDYYILDITNVAWEFIKTQEFAHEKRYRARMEWFHRMNDFPMNFRVSAAYERVNNFNFVAGSGRNNYLGEISFQFDLDKLTRSFK